MSHNMGPWAHASKCIAPRQKNKVHFHSPRFSQQYVLNCSTIKVSCNCIPFHVNFALHLAIFITLLRLYVCLHCSCNLSLDFLCILISYKMLYWTHMKNISPWLGWKDRSKHFKQRHLTPVAESALDVWCVRFFFLFKFSFNWKLSHKYSRELCEFRLKSKFTFSEIN